MVLPTGVNIIDKVPYRGLIYLESNIHRGEYCPNMSDMAIRDILGVASWKGYHNGRRNVYGVMREG